MSSLLSSFSNDNLVTAFRLTSSCNSRIGFMAGSRCLCFIGACNNGRHREYHNQLMQPIRLSSHLNGLTLKQNNNDNHFIILGQTVGMKLKRIFAITII